MIQTGRFRRTAAVGAVALLTAAAFATAAFAHVERTSYWPDPRPDTSVKPAAGGKPPKVRSLASALPRKHDKRAMKARRFKRGRSFKPRKYRGRVRVVCQRSSLRRARTDIRAARRQGYQDRPTQPLQHLTRKQARRLLAANKRFFKLCGFRQIQPAVTRSHNNDRVIVMPGVYKEQSSRKVAAFPPSCEKYRTTSEKGSGAVSYAFQFHCPNAQALVAVIGRALGPGSDPESSPTGRPDPHGIPNLGKCIRCNFQIEGSGSNAKATVIDAGDTRSGDGAPRGSVKDVGIKADRADGFVLKDMTVRHAAEHDVYVLESDGYQLIRGRYMYGGEYGTLTFASDHGITKVCEAAGNGDAGVYPGGAPDTGAQQADRPDFYPKRRLNQLITRCDSHHNNLGYSGTMGNATHVYKNNFYDNTTGIATDSFYAGGHPGFPQDSSVFEKNNIYSNNFNIYAKDSDVESSTPVPIGVGIMIAGGNGNTVIGNHIYDNWRRGTMLLAVPDAISCAPTPGAGSPPCTPKGASTTSNGNEYHQNVMGRAPNGMALPNGVDFWWDEFPGNEGNCWGPNEGGDGQADHTTSDPPESPTGDPAPGFIAKRDCGSPLNVGKGNSQKEAVLVACAEQIEGTENGQASCDWFNPPPKPGSSSSSATPAAPDLPIVATTSTFPQLPSHCVLLGDIGGTLTCDLFVRRLG
jgi:hypothetical protein